jgi:class 3 adenylate cyclase
LSDISGTTRLWEEHPQFMSAVLARHHALLHTIVSSHGGHVFKAERAARLWGAAERLQQVIGCKPAPTARATYERALAQARAQLGEAAFAAAWAFGRALTLEQAITAALDSATVATLGD